MIIRDDDFEHHRINDFNSSALDYIRNRNKSIVKQKEEEKQTNKQKRSSKFK
jgi:hypothetical protein